MKNYLYQTQNTYFAQCPDDIKDLARQELILLGAEDTRIGYRGIHFRGDKAALYRINYHGRFITRVLAPLISFDCPTERHLYKQAFQIPWDDFLTTAGTFAIYAALVRSQLNHSQFAALRLKDAIADSFRSRHGNRPSIDTRNPDVWFNLYIEDDRATISVDTSGGSLHRRGYRPESVSAPMMETLAAAIISYSAWNGETPLYDPFCGSGTILCEAYIRASRMPAGMLRKEFGLEKLPDFDLQLWKEIVREGKKGMASVKPGIITGSDISAEAVALARRNAHLLNPGHRIRIEERDIFQLDSLSGKTIICNPPYGIRMGKGMEMDVFYQNLGDFFKKCCINSTAYVYFGERNYIKKIGLKATWKKALSNGGLDGRLVRYDLY